MIRRYLVSKVDCGDVLTRDKVRSVFKHLILVAYILKLEGGRGWAKLSIQKKDGSFCSSFASAAFTIKGSALREMGDGTFSLTFTEKGSSWEECERTHPLTAQFCHYLKRSINLVPRAYFLVCVRNLGLAMSENNLLRFVGDISFSNGRSVTISHFQHIFPGQHGRA